MTAILKSCYLRFEPGLPQVDSTLQIMLNDDGTSGDISPEQSDLYITLWYFNCIVLCHMPVRHENLIKEVTHHETIYHTQDGPLQ